MMLVTFVELKEAKDGISLNKKVPSLNIVSLIPFFKTQATAGLPNNLELLSGGIKAARPLPSSMWQF